MLDSVVGIFRELPPGDKVDGCLGGIILALVALAFVLASAFR